jgi:hypothetical protein
MTKQPGTQLNLDDYADRHNLRLELITAETVEERIFRHKQQSADAKLKRVKDGILLVVAVIFITALGTSCLAISVSRETSVEDKKWAWSMLTLITGAVLGFLFGRASAPR